jgi:hypothetical protein
MINRANQLKFADRIKSISWENVLSNSNAGVSFDNFLNIFKDNYDASFPLKKINQRKIDTVKSPWMTMSICESVQTKNSLYKKFLKNPTERNEKNYKRFKNKLKHVIKIAKKLHYEELFIKYKNDTKMTWKTINTLLNKNVKTKELPNKFIAKNSGESITKPSKIADKFNEYFINIGPQLASKINGNLETSIQKYLTGNFMNSMFLNPITENEMISEVLKLKDNKSPGYDEINAKIIKTVATDISQTTYSIFNLSFATGFIPEQLKLALVTPIFKAGDKQIFENYRPISVLTCFSKLLEKLMYKRLISFIEKSKILTENQYGFRRNKSTEIAIVNLVSKITKAIDEGKYTIGIFLDLSKAFDTVDHDILLKKMEHYGVRGLTLTWFKNYLMNRKQIVKFKQENSKEMKITTGVPQGSVLGPLLFLLYINDIQNCSDVVSFVLFADDTNAFYSNSGINIAKETMQREMNEILKWLNTNKLSINTTKTKLILFRARNKKQLTEIDIKINDQSIEQVKCTKFLGVLIDETLTWNNHIGSV